MHERLASHVLTASGMFATHTDKDSSVSPQFQLISKASATSVPAECGFRPRVGRSVFSIMSCRTLRGSIAVDCAALANAELCIDLKLSCAWVSTNMQKCSAQYPEKVRIPVLVKRAKFYQVQRCNLATSIYSRCLLTTTWQAL